MASLTPREVQVYFQAIKGISAREIGEVLGITTSTVKNHIERIYKKKNVCCREDLILQAKRQGHIR